MALIEVPNLYGSTESIQFFLYLLVEYIKP